MRPPAETWERAIWIAASPDEIRFNDLAVGDSDGVLLNDLCETPRAYGSLISTRLSERFVSVVLDDPTLWTTPSDLELLEIPFTLQFTLRRSGCEFFVYYREPLRYSLESPPPPTPGADPGVAKLAIVIDGDPRMGDVDLESVFEQNETNFYPWSRIGYVQ